MDLFEADVEDDGVAIFRTPQLRPGPTEIEVRVSQKCGPTRLTSSPPRQQRERKEGIYKERGFPPYVDACLVC